MSLEKKYLYALRYVADFLSQNPKPTSIEARNLLSDAGIDSKTAKQIVSYIQRHGPSKYKTKLSAFLKAYTKTEKVLQDQIPSENLSPDYMLINDESTDDTYDFKRELTTDGVEDSESIELDQDLLINDGSFRY